MRAGDVRCFLHGSRMYVHSRPSFLSNADIRNVERVASLHVYCLLTYICNIMYTSLYLCPVILVMSSHSHFSQPTVVETTLVVTQFNLCD